MQVTETLNQGLKRELKVVVPATDMEARMVKRLEGAKDRVQIKGFRPGKVPMAHMRKMYGKSFMAEVVNEILNDTSSLLADRGEKSATRPEVNMTEDEKEADRILEGKADFEFSLAYEVLPPIELIDFSGISVTRQVVDVADDEVNTQIMQIAESAREFTEKNGKAADGDRVTMDYLGKVDGTPFDGGADQDATLVLGSGRFIPGFEDQLVGSKAGEEKTIKVTFPADYPAEHLAGKEAEFDVKVKKVEEAAPLEINDDLAKKLGVESADKLRDIVRGQIESRFGSFTRQKVKRQILDALDEAYKFDAPATLVDAEFNNIWAQIQNELQQTGKTFEDEDTTEDEAREEYRNLADRRVRLGLVLAEIGEKAGVQISDEEMQRAVYDQVRQYPGQEKQVIEYFQKNPDAVAGLRAPLFEEKVVDHLLTVMKVEDKTVSREELMADDDAEEAKPTKKAAAKKASAKKAEGDEKPAAKKAPAKKAAAKKKDD